MKNKKQIFTTVLSVLISVFLVAGVTFAVTTISGTTITLSNGETISNADDGTILLTAITTSLSGDLTVTGNDITFGNGETISNATDGMIVVSGKLGISGVRVATSSVASDLNENFLYVAGNITGIGAATTSAKTFMLEISGTRQVGYNTAYADFDDAGIKVSVTNKATGNAAGYILRGMDVNAKSRDGGVAGKIYGAYITGESRSGTTITDLIGVQANVKQGGNSSGNTIGLYIQDQSPSQTGTTYGLLIEGKADAGENPGVREYGISLQSANGSWGYGLDMSSATIGTADIRLSTGALIMTGAGVPSGTCTNGSIYLNSSATASSTAAYGCIANAWEAL